MGSKNGEIDLFAAAEALGISKDKKQNKETKTASLDFSSSKIQKLMGNSNSQEVKEIKHKQEIKGEKLNFNVAMKQLNLHNNSISQRGELERKLPQNDNTIKKLLEKFQSMPHSPEKIKLGESIKRLRGTNKGYVSKRNTLNVKKESIGTNILQAERQLVNLKKQLSKARGSQIAYFEGEIRNLEGRYPSLRHQQASRKSLNLELPELDAISSIIMKNPRKKERTNGRESREKIGSELRDFAAMIRAETLGESKKGKVAVGYAIMNRVRGAKGFRPSSLRKVLYAKTAKGKSEFSPVDDGNLSKQKRRLTNTDIKLARDIMNNKINNPIGTATFFQNLTIERKRNTWQERAEAKGKLATVAIIGNHKFRKVV